MPSVFQSIVSFFNPQREGPSVGSSRQTLSYTNDAFSLPTHSPSSSPPEPQPHRGSSAFTYPPPTPGTGGEEYYSPFSSSDRLNRFQANNGSPSLLPMHNSASSNSLYPPLDKTWARIRAWLSTEYPELGDTLNWGILPASLAEIELNLGMPLPRAVRESYLLVDGQEAESSAGCSEGLFFGLTLLPLEDVLEEWRFWREVDDDPATGANQQLRDAMRAIPPGWIRREYSCRGWIPLIADKAGNYVGVDLNPGEGGATGQVIVFGRDFDTKIVISHGEGEAGWARFLASFAEDLESREGFELRNSDNESTDGDSEDSVGYDSYFFSGQGGGKGADGVTNGQLRFTGEYKGWTAIEVWADKSYKRWYAKGLVPDEPTPESGAPTESRNPEGEDGDPNLIVHIPSQRSSAKESQAPTPTISVTHAPAKSLLSSPLSTSPQSLNTFNPLPPDNSKSSTESEDVNLMTLTSPPPISSSRQFDSPILIDRSDNSSSSIAASGAPLVPLPSSPPLPSHEPPSTLSISTVPDLATEVPLTPEHPTKESEVSDPASLNRVVNGGT